MISPNLALMFLAQMMFLPTDLPETKSPNQGITSPKSIPYSAIGRMASRRFQNQANSLPSPSPSPQIRVCIINATSVAKISLSVSGTNEPPAYPDFPQGTWTGNAPLGTNSFHYLVRTDSGIPVADRVITFKQQSSQLLLITGDLSTTGPSDKPPAVVFNPTPNQLSWPPNIQFHTFESSNGAVDPSHYRIFNGMPSKILTLRSKSNGKFPSRQIALLAPGDSVLFVHQPSDVEWEAEIESVNYPLSIRQTGTPQNCIIPFFLREGRPDFIRVFESP